MTVAELILIRHGQSAANVAFPEANAAGLIESGLTGRDRDVELTPTGVSQAEAIGRWLAALPPQDRPDVVITSPYLRAKETWRIAAAGLDLPAPTTDERLVDRLLGDLEMLTRAAVRERFPAEVEAMASAGEHLYRPPGGETFGDVAVRLTAFLTDLNRDHAGRRVAVVAHDAVVLMTRAVVESLDWAGVKAVAAGGLVGNASITVFRDQGGHLELDSWNGLAHLT